MYSVLKATGIGKVKKLPKSNISQKITLENVTPNFHIQLIYYYRLILSLLAPRFFVVFSYLLLFSFLFLK